MRAKKIAAMLCAVLLSLSLMSSAFAEGSANVDSGGGGMGTGDGKNYWTNEDGVRITVLHRSGTQAACFDWSNFDENNISYAFTRRSKFDYLHGATLREAGSYTAHKPATSLPVIVGGSGGNSIAAIRRYFTDSGVWGEIATEAGIPYEELISGEYKVLLEPIAYFWYYGVSGNSLFTLPCSCGDHAGG